MGCKRKSSQSKYYCRKCKTKHYNYSRIGRQHYEYRIK